MAKKKVISSTNVELMSEIIAPCIRSVSFILATTSPTLIELKKQIGNENIFSRNVDTNLELNPFVCFIMRISL